MPCATSTSSARARIRRRPTPACWRSSSRRCCAASSQQFSATANRAATSPTSTMRSRPICWPAQLPPAKAAGQVFNVATGRRVTLNETFKLLQGLTSYSGQPKYGPERGGDIKHSLADISKAEAGSRLQAESGFRRRPAPHGGVVSQEHLGTSVSFLNLHTLSWGVGESAQCPLSPPWLIALR